MNAILSEYHRVEVRRQYERIYNSQQGRDLGRWFLTEKGKGADANMGQLIKELQDIEADVIRDLYSSPAPIQSR